MPEKSLPPGLHVILGDSAAGIFRRVFRPPPGRLDIDRDVLSCGPTRACETLEEWEAMRGQFWAEHVPHYTSEPPGVFEAPHPTLDIPGRAQALQKAPQVTLWAGTGLSEQLSAMLTIQLGDLGVEAADKFWIVQFEKHLDGGLEPFGLGMLGEEPMGEHPAPRLLDASELQDYRDLWTAVTSPDPLLIVGFTDTHPTASPWLQRASKQLLLRFPERVSGLNYWDHALLAEVTMNRRKAARVIGGVIGKYWKQCDPVGDLFLFGRLLALGSAGRPKPLIEIFGSGANMRYTEVQLTSFGLDVQEGRASNYPANPIEDWASGVKLSSRDGSLWFREADRLVPA